MLTVYDCKTEHLTDPIGLDCSAPRFSWKLRSDRTNVVQISYRIVVTCDNDVFWDSGLIASDASQNIRYAGQPLQSGQILCWRVEVTDGIDEAISEPASFEMGLLDLSDWKCRWITSEAEIDYNAPKPAPLFRKSFMVRPGLIRARIYQSSHGLYEFWINGAEGTQDRFKPGLTSYQKRVQYQTYDVLSLLQEGENIWAVQLGDGWWRGSTGGGYRNNFGFKLGFIGQLVLTYSDGSTDIVGTDSTFRTATGGLLRSDMKAGDVYDANQEPLGWKTAGFDDAGWASVLPLSEYALTDTLIPSRSVPVREKEVFNAAVFRDGNGKLVLDFGQNIAGYVRMTLRNCSRRQRITLWHGEGLKAGRFSAENIENVGEDRFQCVEYIAKGDPEEYYCPRFSVFGFRYVLMDGYDEANIRPGDFTAIAVYSDLPQTGDFSCSNELINQLVKNSRWSQKGNFLDVPTDCPTRERSAWSGDSQVYVKTASEFMDVYPFFEKWLQDLNLEQFPSGCVGNTFPSTNSLHNAEERQLMIEQNRFVFIPPTMAGPDGEPGIVDGAAGWGDTATITPWTLYLCYGDKQILSQQYESAKRWSLYQRECAKDHNPLYESDPQYHTVTDGVLDADYIFDTKFHWGEWLEPDAPENNGPTAFNPPEWAVRGNPLVATAYLYYSSVLVAKMAKLLNKSEDEADFTAYAENVKRVYNKYFIQSDGTILKGRQAPYARTLAFDLADSETRPKVIQKLAEAVEGAGYTMNTGFLSTPFILQQLTDNGFTDHAFQLLEQTKYPSWLHSVTLGATTILENWNGLDNYTGSFNHYSYGAVCDFLFSRVAGIQPDESVPGYKHFFLQPVTGGTLTHAEASYDSVYGRIRSSWRKSGDVVKYSFEIPANTKATVLLPGQEPVELGSGSYDF